MSLRTILIWCIIAGLLGGAAVFIRDRSAAASATIEVRWAGLEFDPAGVTMLRIASGDDSAVIERDPQSVGAWQGRWDIRDESTAWSITPTRVRGALRMLSTGQVRLSEEPLVDSGTLVELTLRDGSGVELTIGTDRSGGRAPARITRRDESGAIERVQHGWMESGIADALNAQSTLAWRDTSLITAAMSSVTGVAVTAGPYASELRLVGSRWRLVEPIEVHANRERTETLIRTVLGLKAEGFVEQAIDQAASGLDRPLAEIRLTTRDGVYTLRIGQAADVGGDSLYAEFSTGDSSTLIRVATSSLSKLTAAPDAYVGTVASAGASTDVSGVRVLGRGGDVRFEAVRDAGAWMSSGERVDTINENAIARLVRQLHQAEADAVRVIDAEQMPRAIAGLVLVDSRGEQIDAFDVAIEQSEQGIRLLVSRDLGDERRVVWAYVGEEAQATGTWLTLTAGRPAASN